MLVDAFPPKDRSNKKNEDTAAPPNIEIRGAGARLTEETLFGETILKFRTGGFPFPGVAQNMFPTDDFMY